MVFPACFAIDPETEVCRKTGRILRSGIIAGSPCTPEDFLEICRFASAMHPAAVLRTDRNIAPHCHWTGTIRTRSRRYPAGHVIEHVKARIVDFGTGSQLLAGKNEKIQVLRATTPRFGYYHLPEANAKVFTEDGWVGGPETTGTLTKRVSFTLPGA